jgi:hypothetical protein
MGSITRGLSNNITTGGVILPAGITNASVSAVTSFANASAGTLILLSTQTASASANISFTTGLNSTYDEYIFKFIDIHPASDGNRFLFQGSTDSGSNYGVNITSSFFKSFHNEAGSSAGVSYDVNNDLAQSTSYQQLNLDDDLGADNDQSLNGELHIFNPSSTTYVKHFMGTSNFSHKGDFTVECFYAGYFNTTSAINAIDFKMSSGNIDDGVIKLYGVKKS